MFAIRELGATTLEAHERRECPWEFIRCRCETLNKTIPAAFLPDGRLIFPAHYREWIFLSSGLDMSYTEAPPMPGSSMFDNVFVNPEAFREFQRTGTWPEHTLLAMESRGGSTQGSINKRGKFQTDDFMGVEVHVKDTQRFTGGWGFFAFENTQPAQPIPSTAPCYSCHREHGAVDTTERPGTARPGSGGCATQWSRAASRS